MSTKLHISDELSLPLDIITMRVALYGDSGAGKTTFARLMAEKIHEAGHRFCAIDLKNDWWGLKASADGTAAGIPVVIFGGPRADVKLFEDAGPALADTITSIEQSVVIDLDAMNRRMQEIFLGGRVERSGRYTRVPGFLDQLYEKNRRPLMLFCDEADRYAPQKPMTEDAILSLSSSEDIARRGRKRGIGSVWLTQRTAVLAKNVSEFANLVVVFRTPGSRDLKELEERVGRIADKQVVADVVKLAPGLQDGEAFFLSAHPKLRNHLPNPVRPIQLPLPWTFDSSATPAVGQRRKEPKVLAQADLAAIESRMAQQVEQAKASDPAHLKRRVAELEKQLAHRPKEQVEKTVEKIVEVPVLKNGQLDRTEKIADRLQAFADKFTVETAELRRLIAPAAAPRPVPSPMRPIHSVPRTAVMTRPLPKRQQEPPQEIGDFTINKVQQRILNALAWYESLGEMNPTTTQVGAVALIDPTGGYFSNTVGPLSSVGLVVRGGGTLQLTDEGRKVAQAVEDVGTLEEYHDVLRERVRKMKSASNKTIEILDAIISAGGESLTTAQIGEAVGVDHMGGYFSNSIGPLGTVGLIERRQGMVTPTSVLFPPGLRVNL